jgi:hypothetical protein
MCCTDRGTLKYFASKKVVFNALFCLSLNEDFSFSKFVSTPGVRA